MFKFNSQLTSTHQTQSKPKETIRYIETNKSLVNKLLR